MTLPNRKPSRLPHFDYSTPGAYFVTICTHNRKNLLSQIVGDGSPVPKPFGRIAEAFIRRIPEKYPSVYVDKYVVMPNHIHLLLQTNGTGGTGNPSPTLGNIIGWYKYQITKQVNLKYAITDVKLFQRSYHDHVVRSERDYLKIWQYIDTNPAKRKEDCFFVNE